MWLGPLQANFANNLFACSCDSCRPIISFGTFHLPSSSWPSVNSPSSNSAMAVLIRATELLGIRSASLFTVWTSARQGASIWARCKHGDPIMRKFSMLGIIGGAALLAAVPFSLQWSQGNVGSAVPLLTVSHADAQTAGMVRRQARRTARTERRQARRTARTERRAIRRGVATPQ